MVPTPRTKSPAKKAPQKAKKSVPAQAKATVKIPVKKVSSKKIILKKPEVLKKAGVMKEINEVEKEMKELSRDVADVNYNMSSMILAILIVAVMALGGYFYSMSTTAPVSAPVMPAVVERMETLPPAPAVAVSLSLPTEVVSSLLAQISALTTIKTNELVSANIIKNTNAPQTYKTGDYVFVFQNEMIVYRAETNKIQSIVNFTLPTTVATPLPPQ